MVLRANRGEVKSQNIKTLEGNAERVKSKKEFAKIRVGTSNIKAAGRGVFAEELISKGSYITEYGGKVVFREDSKKLSEHSQDTHLRSLTKGFDALDGRVHDGDDRVNEMFTLKYYEDNHLCGSLVNDAYGSQYSSNAASHCTHCITLHTLHTLYHVALDSSGCS